MPSAVRLVRAGDSTVGSGEGGHHAESVTEQLTEIRRPVSWLRPRARRKTRAGPRQGDGRPTAGPGWRDCGRPAGVGWWRWPGWLGERTVWAGWFPPGGGWLRRAGCEGTLGGGRA